MVTLLLVTVVLSLTPFVAAVQFIAIGDWGDNQPAGVERQKVVAQRMSEWCSANTCDFIFSLGDNFYPQGVTSPTDSRFDTSWSEIYDIYPILAEKVWYQSIGNHDHAAVQPGDGREWNQVLFGQTEPRWYFPDRWYDFVYNDPDGYSVHFVVLDSQSLRWGINSPATQLNWLEETLSASTSQWKVVIVHHPPYSAGSHGPVDSTIEQQVVPIAKRHAVQLLLSAHDHNLQHIVNATNANDIHYVISGGGGRATYPQLDGATNILRLRGFDIPFFGSTYGFTDLKFGASEVTVRHIDDNGDVVHTFGRSVETKVAAHRSS